MGFGASSARSSHSTAPGGSRATRSRATCCRARRDVPPLELGHQVTPSPFTPLGAKGAGRVRLRRARSPRSPARSTTRSRRSARASSARRSRQPRILAAIERGTRGAMIAHHFDYLAPASAEEALATLAAAPQDTRVLGGGTWVVTVELNRGLARARRGDRPAPRRSRRDRRARSASSASARWRPTRTCSPSETVSSTCGCSR